MAKTAASLPRPDADSRVQTLSLWAQELRQREADTPTEVEDSYGFPSGHVSTTTAFAVGLAMLAGGRRRKWAVVVAWIAAMAVSRMYLGRHFLADVIGGVCVGLGAVAVAWFVLKLDHLVRESRAHHPWPAHRVMAVAVVLAGGALLAGLPDAGDAGRLLGTAAGTLFLVTHDVFTRVTTPRSRVVLVTASAVGFGAAWMVMRAALGDAPPASISAVQLAASAVPHASLLIVPALVPLRLLTGRPLLDLPRAATKRRS
jgi:hypothetical protein